MSGLSTPPEENNSRRNFIIGLIGLFTLPIAGWLYYRSRKNSPSTLGENIPVRIAGQSHSSGHLLRDQSIQQQMPVELTKKVVIVGAGIAGLTAARSLTKAGIDDLLILEHESNSGGNSSSRSNRLGSYPLGAHYLPIPDISYAPLKEFLEANKIIQGYNAQGVPLYNEEYLCFAPDERLYIHGLWQDGLVPQIGNSAETNQEIKRFLKKMDEFREAKSVTDNKFAFAIPVASSSKDPIYTTYDSYSMKEFMQREGYKSEELLWYVDYCCRDDYGTNISDTSAWAGIHYFAARRGVAANAERGDVLTWPQGNHFLVSCLEKEVKAEQRTGCLVYKINQDHNSCSVDFLDLQEKKLYRVHCEKIILATPQFINARLINNPERKTDLFSYAPWMVANMVVQAREEDKGAPLSWDNVIYKSPSLGYVNSSHQTLQQKHEHLIYTYYYAFSDMAPAEARKKMLAMSTDEWKELILKDLKRPHKQIAERIDNIEVWMWGHAMVRPVPGFITSEQRAAAARPIGRVHFAHSDLSGLSIFEEAFHQGIRAAEEIIHSI